MNTLTDAEVAIRAVEAGVIDEAFRAAFALRVCSTALTLAWVAVGRHAGYITNGPLVDSVHFTAGTALCQAAGASSPTSAAIPCTPVPAWSPPPTPPPTGGCSS